MRQMEAVTSLTTANGEVALPTDYLLWRTIRPNAVTRWPWEELDYVHPAYLPPTTALARRHSAAIHHRGQAVQDRGRWMISTPMNSTTTAKSHRWSATTLNTNWLLDRLSRRLPVRNDDGGQRARAQCGSGATLQGAARRGAGRDHPAIGADHRRHQPERADSGIFLACP